MEKCTGHMIKAEFVKHLQKEFKEILGEDINLEKAYELFKMSILLPYQLASKKNIKIVLGGVGVFRLYKTRGGNITTKYYTSDTVVRCLTKGYDLRDYVHNPQKYRNPDGTISETPAKKVEAKKEEKPKKAETKKVEVKKAEVKKEEEEKSTPKKATIKSTPAPKSSIPKKAVVEAQLQQEIDDDVLDDLDFSEFEL